MIKQLIALVRLVGMLVNFVYHEDTQKLFASLHAIAERFPIDKLTRALDLTIQRLSTECKTPEPDTLHDARYAADRIGVGDKTIYRLTEKGELPIARYLNRRRQFRKSDIERCRRMYGRD